MRYLESIRFPDAETEFDFFNAQKRTCFTSFYPFKVLSRNGLSRLDFAPITILYGGNGSGKTTALNLIAEKAGLIRETPFNRSSFWADYLALCRLTTLKPWPENSRIVTSDDVFDSILNLRALNEGIDQKRGELFDEYLDAKYADFRVASLADFEQLKTVNAARRKTQSKFVKERLMDNVHERSNGETAFAYFTEKLDKGGLYLLDEPENSLSPKRQIELAKYLLDSARFFDCQLIIATHAPFLLAIPEAKVYDLDENPVAVRPWVELKNVRAYHDFFQANRKAFETPNSQETTPKER